MSQCRSTSPPLPNTMSFSICPDVPPAARDAPCASTGLRSDKAKLAPTVPRNIRRVTSVFGTAHPPVMEARDLRAPVSPNRGVLHVSFAAGEVLRQHRVRTRVQGHH